MNFSNLSKVILAIGLFVSLNSNFANAESVQDVSNLPTCPSVCNSSKDQASCAATKVPCKVGQFDKEDSKCEWGFSKLVGKERCKSVNSAKFVCKGRCETISKKQGKCSGDIVCNENDDKELRDVTCSEKIGMFGKSCVPVLKG